MGKSLHELLTGMADWEWPIWEAKYLNQPFGSDTEWLMVGKICAAAIGGDARPASFIPEFEKLPAEIEADRQAKAHRDMALFVAAQNRAVEKKRKAGERRERIRNKCQSSPQPSSNSPPTPPNTAKG